MKKLLKKMFSPYDKKGKGWYTHEVISVSMVNSKMALKGKKI